MEIEMKMLRRNTFFNYVKTPASTK